jgi:hypothetical protein
MARFSDLLQLVALYLVYLYSYENVKIVVSALFCVYVNMINFILYLNTRTYVRLLHHTITLLAEPALCTVELYWSCCLQVASLLLRPCSLVLLFRCALYQACGQCVCVARTFCCLQFFFFLRSGRMRKKLIEENYEDIGIIGRCVPDAFWMPVCPRYRWLNLPSIPKYFTWVRRRVINMSNATEVGLGSTHCPCEGHVAAYCKSTTTPIWPCAAVGHSSFRVLRADGAENSGRQVS